MDDLRHPDLVLLAKSMRATFDRVLEVEHAAATVAHRRTRELREMLLDLEDRRAHVRVTVGGTRVGPTSVSAVGLDHLVLGADRSPTIIPIRAIEMIEVVA